MQQANTLNNTGATIPDRAVYIAAFAMAIGTGSIAVRYYMRTLNKRFHDLNKP